MGNTKLIYIEGEFERDMSPTEAQLMEWSHGSYCTAKVVPGGYLGQGENGAEYFIASLHTSSMVGVNVVDRLAEHAHLMRATIVVADLEWTDVKIHHISDRDDGDDAYHHTRVYEYAAPPPTKPTEPQPEPADMQQCAADPRCAGDLVCEQKPIGWRFWCILHSPHDHSGILESGVPSSAPYTCKQGCKVENTLNAVAVAASMRSKPASER